MHMVVRRVDSDDQMHISYVESQSTPRLRYLDRVFTQFYTDTDGDFALAEIDGKVVGCGKLTPMPDGSAWLESLRVVPSSQGLGVGKQFYRRFFAFARERGIPTLRMYTNESNVVSKGLAERFGFREVAAYRGYILPASDFPTTRVGEGWQPLFDPELAITLIMEQSPAWDGFLVMNRTFYAITPGLVRMLVAQNQVYQHVPSHSLMIMGSRFMPEQALHIALMTGDLSTCLTLAVDRARTLGAGRLQCMFPPVASHLEAFLAGHGFGREDQDLVVMEASTLQE